MNRIRVFAALVFATACGQLPEVERPRDPWVFRSVLDERPRMITMALHDHLWAAYDVQRCGLYKAWSGGVDFDGAVYTTRHGPQPVSYGTEYLMDPMYQPIWFLSTGGQTVPITPQYRGHKFKNNQVTLVYELDLEGRSLMVEETPEYDRKDYQHGLKRTFNVSGLETGEVLQLSISMSNLAGRFAYQTNGEFRVNSSEQALYGGVRSYTVKGVLNLGNGSTGLTAYFKVAQPMSPKQDTPGGNVDVLAMGAELIENSDCKTCHNETERTVGPSYLEVAQRYPTSDGSVRELVEKVILGGTGNWGQVPMTAHPDLQEADARKMVQYILSLDKEEAPAAAPDEFLGQSTIPLELSELPPPQDDNQYPGLAVGLYVYEDHNVSPQELLEISRPVLTGTAPAIHVVDRSGFGKFNNNILLEFKGIIRVDQDQNVDFRLLSDDGSYLYINDRLIIDNGGFHGVEARDGEVILRAGTNDIRVIYFQGASEGAVSLQWAPHGSENYEIVPSSVFFHQGNQRTEAIPYISPSLLVRSIPGDQSKLQGVHPSFDLTQARPDGFTGRIGGMDFLSDGTLAVCTWDSLGPVYLLKGVETGDPQSIEVTRIATGLAEPLGLKVVDDEIFVLQKQELTHLIDHDGDKIIDEYRTICDDWKVSANFHEFAFGLEYQDGFFYAALATAINPGGASTQPQIPDRGKVIRISREDGSLEFMAHGLRTPNGIGKGIDQELFIADNQGDWLPSSKIVHVQEGAWYGSRSVDYAGTANLSETKPVVWLPQDEIGNSPSQPVRMQVGPYTDQMIHGEVTHGGIKRVFVEKVNGQYQGAVFRFTQGMEAGVNRLLWGPDGSLYVGGVGSSGNWSDGQQWYGLQRLTYNGKTTFEILAVRAKTDGMELEFTAPIEEGRGHTPEEYLVKQWYYLPTENYGGPKLGLETLAVASVNLSQDRKKVFLELPGMEAGHLVHVRIYRPFRSVEGQSLWSTEAWYTLNSIPQNQPGFKSPITRQPPNTLTASEQAAGWKLLFDGRTTNGWRNFKSNTPGSAWKIQEGALLLDNRNKQNGRIVGGGDIITAGSYENFELALEWKVQPGGNSGIMFNVVEEDQYDYPWQTGPEMQILDNLNHPDGRIKTHRAGDLYDMIACKFVAANGANEWNMIRIVSNQGKVTHWVNGYQVVSYQMHTDQWRDMIAKSKFRDMPGFGRAQGGHIALQDHGDMVWFRNIKIKEL